MNCCTHQYQEDREYLDGLMIIHKSGWVHNLLLSPLRRAGQVQKGWIMLEKLLGHAYEGLDCWNSNPVYQHGWLNNDLSLSAITKKARLDAGLFLCGILIN